MMTARQRCGMWAVGLVAGLLVACATAQPSRSASPTEAARRLVAEGKVGAAIDVLNRVSDAGRRSVEVLDLRAELHLMQGNDAAAERDWLRAAQLEPTAISPRLALARLHSHRALWPDAVALYREVLLFAPRNVDAILGLANALQHSGRTVGARRLIEAAAETIGDRRIQEQWARMALEAGHPEDAEKALRLIVDGLQGIAKTDALNRLASLYAKSGRLDEALAAVRESLTIERAAGKTTNATYDLMADVADQTVTKITAGIGATLAELGNGALHREHALAETARVRERLTDVESLVQGIDAPADRGAANAGRLYAYSLAGEAVVSALTYVDVGGDSRRATYLRALKSTQKELRRVGHRTPVSSSG